MLTFFEIRRKAVSIHYRMVIAVASVAVVLGLLWSKNEFFAGGVDFSKTPVLFVHGHGLSSGNWKELKRFLQRKGYPDDYLLAVDIRPNRMSNSRASAVFVAPAVEELLATARAAASAAGQNVIFERVDIVAHSMGAVSSRLYAATIRPDRVRTWISAAGSNHGTNALCNHIDDGAIEMCPAFAADIESSQIQLTLNGTALNPVDESPFGIGRDSRDSPSVSADTRRNIIYYTIRIDPDSWIAPADSALLDGAGGISLPVDKTNGALETSPGNYLFLREVDHMSLLRHGEFHSLVAAMLSARD